MATLAPPVQIADTARGFRLSPKVTMPLNYAAVFFDHITELRLGEFIPTIKTKGWDCTANFTFATSYVQRETSPHSRPQSSNEKKDGTRGDQEGKIAQAARKQKPTGKLAGMRARKK